MNKLTQIYCKQAPFTPIPCEACKIEHKIDSKDLLKDKTYILNCDKCNKETTVYTEQYISSFEKQLKKLGVRW